jgi:hypothetical protein
MARSNVGTDMYTHHVIRSWLCGSDMARTAVGSGNNVCGIYVFSQLQPTATAAGTVSGSGPIRLSHGALPNFIYDASSSTERIMGNLSTNP